MIIRRQVNIAARQTQGAEYSGVRKSPPVRIVVQIEFEQPQTKVELLGKRSVRKGKCGDQAIGWPFLAFEITALHHQLENAGMGLDMIGVMRADVL
ncbi:hypothetical protein K3174_11475 [Qipengyuania sp. 6D47A]|uniref:Uncharacterized protein n=1 Tax=Qipengyuania qiaonensis TaxID=2867240 RepID=A0ABS7J774_9SPHN|nr:hypothetical protein [Qipengyuania qiaonensis]MBX7483152.1 hypothetical protein [Qipengyuania qiaonensis]